MTIITAKTPWERLRSSDVGGGTGGMMPWFYFDLILDNRAHDQGGMILEDEQGAKDRADALASELCKVKPELEGHPCFVRVVSEANEEIYRVALDHARWSLKTIQN